MLALQLGRAALRERKEKTAYKIGRGAAMLIELCPLDPIRIIGLEFSTSTHLSLFLRRNIYDVCPS